MPWPTFSCATQASRRSPARLYALAAAMDRSTYSSVLPSKRARLARAPSRRASVSGPMSVPAAAMAASRRRFASSRCPAMVRTNETVAAAETHPLADADAVPRYPHELRPDVPEARPCGRGAGRRAPACSRRSPSRSFLGRAAGSPGARAPPSPRCLRAIGEPPTGAGAAFPAHRPERCNVRRARRGRRSPRSRCLRALAPRRAPTRPERVRAPRRAASARRAPSRRALPRSRATRRPGRARGSCRRPRASRVRPPGRGRGRRPARSFPRTCSSRGDAPALVARDRRATGSRPLRRRRARRRPRARRCGQTRWPRAARGAPRVRAVRVDSVRRGARCPGVSSRPSATARISSSR